MLGASPERPLLTLTRLHHPTPVPPTSTGLFHAALLHSTRADLAETLLRVASAGWPLSGAADHGVSEALYLDDPDGLGLELYVDRPRESWPAPAAGERIRMFTRALDLDDLMSTARARPSPFMSPETVIGHVHLKVADLERSVRFYRDGLGLELQALLPSAAFLAADGYHHHVGANTWQSLGGGPAPESAPGLRLFEVEVGDEEALTGVQHRLAQLRAVETHRRENRLMLSDPDRHGLMISALRLTHRPR